MLKSRHWDRIAELRAAVEANAGAGNFDTAREQAHQAAQLALQAGGQADPRVAECFYHLADIHTRAGDLTAAEPAYNAACSILNPTEGEATPLKADLLLDYGSLYANMRLGWRAILLLDHAKSRFAELYGPDSEGVGRCQAMIAVSYESTGMEEEALDAYREAHRILAGVRGENTPASPTSSGAGPTSPSGGP
jgi:tetratricopeptide (TPR) repeat protein